MSNQSSAVGRTVTGLSSIDGPIVVVEGRLDVAYDEVVIVRGADGEDRRGRVLEAGERAAVIQVFAGTEGLSSAETVVQFTGGPMRIPVSEEMLGRVFDGLGRPQDGYPDPLPEDWRDINGNPLNPTSRTYPQDIIITGISAIDGMNTLILGQKLPVFSGSGLPHDEIAAQIVRQATVRFKDQAESVPKEGSGDFAIVFAALGAKHDVADFFRDAFSSTGALSRVSMFLNLADDPAVERVVTPRVALTLAEFLAYDKGMNVLVVMTDMTNYCEALRQVSSARGEIPSRKGYPGYLYSDLAALYERTGRIEGRSGSITQLPILTMPNDDITHPVPDLTGYITEGQIVLNRDLYQQGIYPPVSILPSLSRLMKDSIGEGFTRDDHPHVASQLYAAYAGAQNARSLASVIGEEELSAVDQAYLRFGEDFERQFLSQGQTEARSTVETLDIAWDVLSVLPRSELTRVREEEIDAHYHRTPDAVRGRQESMARPARMNRPGEDVHHSPSSRTESDG